MAKVRVTGDAVSEMLFVYADYNVDVDGGYYDHNRDEFVFNISGPGIPSTEEVICVCSVQQNRRGERLLKHEFRAA